VRWIGAEEAARFACDVLLDPARRRPVVAVSTDPRTGLPTVDPEALARELGDSAQVVALATGDATWALSEALPSRLDVYGGAVRIWWPGLSTTSDPYDHALLFVRNPEEARLVAERVVAAVRGGDARAGRYGPWRPAPAAGVAPDAERRPRPERPDPWRRLAEVYRAGDVVRGRICRIEAKFVLVEVLPGVALLAPIQELDWGFVEHPGAMFRIGERVNVKILQLDLEARRGTVSVKQAYASQPLPAVSPAPDEPPFLADDAEGEGGAPEAPLAGEADLRQLREELESVLADRKRLMRQNQELKEQNQELKRSLRSAEDRLRAIEARFAVETVPTASETAFLAAVRVEYARRFDEGDRQRYPLQRMRVGREFLERLRRLEGVSVEKVVEVCAQVACGRAHEIPGRSVHPLHEGSAGAAPRLRRADSARAWRCSLQDGTPSARRLHWWDIPGPEGRTIEFASVGVHDDDSIPA
jgi:predicted RNA-binding protein with RPS1 domain